MPPRLLACLRLCGGPPSGQVPRPPVASGWAERCPGGLGASNGETGAPAALSALSQRGVGSHNLGLGQAQPHRERQGLPGPFPRPRVSVMDSGRIQAPRGPQPCCEAGALPTPDSQSGPDATRSRARLTACDCAQRGRHRGLGAACCPPRGSTGLTWVRRKGDPTSSVPGGSFSDQRPRWAPCAWPGDPTRADGAWRGK